MQKITVSAVEIGKFAILLPPEPDPAEVTAAQYLQKAILKTAGAKLEITSAPAEHSIKIGFGSTEGIKYDGFTVSTDEKNIYLRGRIPRGTLYAVYDFAERFLGVRHFAPDCEIYPTEGGAEIPAGYSLTDNPVFDYRHADWLSFMNSREFASLSRLNAYKNDRFGGHSRLAAGCHTFMYLCPPEKYFADHPEYFSFWNGRRIPAGNTDADDHGQLCLTNPDVIRIVTENVLAQLRADPGMRVVDVSQNDNQHYCCCPECARVDEEEGSHAGTVIRFVNAVAEAVEREFPDALVQTFAYQYTRQAPKITRPRKNVLIRYCTIEACFSHPLNDANCYKNGPLFAKELAEWGQAAAQMTVWDYTTNYANLIAPFPNIHVLRPNMRFFAENRALGVFEEDIHFACGGDFAPLRAYLVSKLLWNPYMDEEEFERHKREFLAAYFGPGWKLLYESLQLETEAVSHHEMYCFDGPISDKAFLETWPDPEKTLEELYRQKYRPTFFDGLYPLIPRLRANWEEALKLAETETQRFHVRRSAISVDHLEIFRPRNKDEMTEAERAQFEAAAKKHFENILCFDLDLNLYMGIHAESRRGHLRPVDAVKEG